MKQTYNPILDTDSYKPSHPDQFPKGTTSMSSYVEARGSTIQGVYKTQMFGLQGYIKEYLSTPATLDNVEEAAEEFAMQGVPFKKDAWEYIVKEHGGFAPISIHAIEEGINVPINLPVARIDSIDPKVFWAPGHYETQILRAIWYGSTVSTVSKTIKDMIYRGLVISSDDPDSQINFKLHDFGSRGCSSYETSQVGGAAHLVNFMGSDTIAATPWLRRNYDAKGFVSGSIPAAEHSTITSWGRPYEQAAYSNMIKQFGVPGAYFAVVVDAYDMYNAVDVIWGRDLKQEVIDSGATVVLRPDSGNPKSMVMYCLRSLQKSFGYTINSKGYKVLNNVRIIQGDGVNMDSIEEILTAMLKEMFSIDNIAFGMGGALLQRLDRDTFKWAMKCSSVTVNGVEVDVYKDPKTDPGKASKRGIVSTFLDDRIGFYSDRITPGKNRGRDMLTQVYRPGFVKSVSFDAVRKNSSIIF
jgi:nicotinamide phosphoribosyltransferase